VSAFLSFPRARGAVGEIFPASATYVGRAGNDLRSSCAFTGQHIIPSEGNSACRALWADASAGSSPSQAGQASRPPSRCADQASLCELGRQREGQGRGLGGGGGQPVRARRYRDGGHHFSAGARHQRGAIRRFHPDRCADQPWQFGRAELRSERPRYWHQYRNLLAVGRFGGDRLRGPVEHRKERRCAIKRARARDARLARRRGPEHHSDDRQEPRARSGSAEGRTRCLGDPEQPGSQGRDQAGRCDFERQRTSDQNRTRAAAARRRDADWAEARPRSAATART
jgi:hypothetical protein